MKNVCELFNTSGNLSKYYGYTPFGAVSSSSGTNQPFQWSSEVYDEELDLVYYNYRHYSPSLGRFLFRDPIEEQGGLNRYAFVGNNPVRAIDFLGYEDVVVPLDAYFLSVNFRVSYGTTSSFSLVRTADDCPNKEPGDMSPYVESGVFDYGVFVRSGMIGENSDITFQTRLGIRTEGSGLWGKFWNFEVVSEASVSANMEWQRLVPSSSTGMCGCLRIKGSASVTLEVEVRPVRIAAVAVMIEVLPVVLPAVGKAVVTTIGTGIRGAAIPVLA